MGTIEEEMIGVFALLTKTTIAHITTTNPLSHSFLQET
jgi:hypothetical protein